MKPQNATNLRYLIFEGCFIDESIVIKALFPPIEVQSINLLHVRRRVARRNLTPHNFFTFQKKIFRFYWFSLPKGENGDHRPPFLLPIIVMRPPKPRPKPLFRINILQSFLLQYLHMMAWKPDMKYLVVIARPCIQPTDILLSNAKPMP